MSGNPYDPGPGGSGNGDKPEKPEIPASWHQPPDPNWPPPKTPPRKRSVALQVLLWTLVAVVMVPLIGVALLFGACLLNSR